MKRKKNFYILSLLLFAVYIQLYSQNIKNFGDIEIHQNGQLGLFGSVVNDGLFFSRSGLVGFYGENYFDISGSVNPKLFDIEVANVNNVLLNIPVTISNNANFIIGDLKTSKTDSLNYVNFTTTSFSNGASDFSKVNGYVKATITDSFIFPIGDEFYLRPLAAETNFSNVTYTACYVSEDVTKTHPLGYSQEVSNINTKEYWILKGASEVTITINWNDRSRIERITHDSDDLCIVGFEISSSKWKNLGGIDNTGDVTSGFLTSEPFVPNKYAAITFGVLTTDKKTQTEPTFNGYHYIVSPNGDGINDNFIIEELADYKNNLLKIYDRNGLLVFEAENYIDEFTGSTGKGISAVDRDSGLAQGIYYYIAAVNGGEFTVQGFLYIDR